jgi:hypothetical protein
MTLHDLLPEVQSLSCVEKLHLIQFLAQDLAQGDGSQIFEAHQSYPVWSPHEAFDAAAVLLDALKTEKGQP